MLSLKGFYNKRLDCKWTLQFVYSLQFVFVPLLILVQATFNDRHGKY